jgi:hypothetical protein
MQTPRIEDLEKIDRLDAALAEIESNTYNNSTELKVIARKARAGDV